MQLCILPLENVRKNHGDPFAVSLLVRLPFAGLPRLLSTSNHNRQVRQTPSQDKDGALLLAQSTGLEISGVTAAMPHCAACSIVTATGDCSKQA